MITQDCTRTAHGGYAYFTLDCVDAVIKSTGCGDELEMEMEAPDGFRYFWTTTEDRENAFSTERAIKVPTNDTTTYDENNSYTVGTPVPLFQRIDKEKKLAEIEQN